MKIGDLVKGKVNRCIGVVTEVLQCEHQLRPDLYKDLLGCFTTAVNYLATTR